MTYRIGTRDGMGNRKDKVARGAVFAHGTIQRLLKFYLNGSEKERGSGAVAVTKVPHKCSTGCRFGKKQQSRDHLPEELVVVDDVEGSASEIALTLYGAIRVD